MSSARGRLFSLGLNEIMCNCPSLQADISMNTWKYGNTHPQALHANTMTITPGAIPNTLLIHEMGFIPKKVTDTESSWMDKYKKIQAKQQLHCWYVC